MIAMWISALALGIALGTLFGVYLSRPPKVLAHRERIRVEAGLELSEYMDGTRHLPDKLRVYTVVPNELALRLMGIETRVNEDRDVIPILKWPGSGV